MRMLIKAVKYLVYIRLAVARNWAEIQTFLVDAFQGFAQSSKLILVLCQYLKLNYKFMFKASNSQFLDLPLTREYRFGFWQSY